MSGSDFVAVVRISTKSNATLALPGETCGRVPSAALEWLERSGKIRRDAPERLIEPGVKRALRRKRDEEVEG